MSHFDDIESLYSDLRQAAIDLSESERSEFMRFVDVGEYGLALETLVDIYAEEGKAASPEVIDLIGRLAERMSMNAADLLRRLRRRD